MPQAALGLLQRVFVLAKKLGLVVSMPQAALGLLQLPYKFNKFENIVSFNAASGIRAVATREDIWHWFESELFQCRKRH